MADNARDTRGGRAARFPRDEPVPAAVSSGACAEVGTSHRYLVRYTTGDKVIHLWRSGWEPDDRLRMRLFRSPTRVSSAGVTYRERRLAGGLSWHGGLAQPLLRMDPIIVASPASEFGACSSIGFDAALWDAGACTLCSGLTWRSVAQGTRTGRSLSPRYIAAAGSGKAPQSDRLRQSLMTRKPCNGVLKCPQNRPGVVTTA